MRQHIIAIALSAISLVAAQNFTINPGEVDAGKRSSWCLAEINSCGTLCGQITKNDCNPTDLTFNCICKNGTAPGLQYYTQTMPTFICQQAFEDCNLAHVGNKTGQDACKTDIQNKCGTLDPTKVQVGGGDSSSTSSAPSNTGTGSPSGTGGGAATSTTSKGAAATNLVYLGNGAAAVAAGLFAALI